LAAGFGRGVELCDPGGGGRGPAGACASKCEGPPRQIVARKPIQAVRKDFSMFELASNPAFGIH
jgi:hypothetical protein